MKKGKRRIAYLLSIAMLISVLFSGNAFAAEGAGGETLQNDTNVEVEAGQNSEIDENVSSDGNVEISDETKNAPEEEKTVTTKEDSEHASFALSEEDAEDDIVPASQGLINYVGVDYPYLETPADQNIVISYGDGSEDVSDARLVAQKDDGNTLEMSLFKKEGELLLFTYRFDETACGVYELIDFIYTQDGTEQTIHFADIGIESMFGVDEKYPGYGEAFEESSEEVTDQELEMSVVDVETGEVEAATTDIEKAIEATEEQVSTATESRASRAAVASKSDNLVVVLDPGHGGYDGGASANGLVEKNLTLKIAQYCKAELEQYNGVTVHMTRTDDTYLDIDERVYKARDLGADVLVSIHINSSTASAANGAEVWYPNANYNGSIHAEGQNLAQQIQNQLVALGLGNRGIQIRTATYDTYPDGSKEDWYGIIRYSKYCGFPGIIVEHAFISNPSDAAKLAQESFLRQLGIADATGIANAYGLTKGPNIDIENKNDFDGTAKIDVSGLGSNGSVRIWNEETGASKEYTLASGKQTINFNVADYNGVRGTFYVEAFNSSGQSLIKETFYVSKDTSSTIVINPDENETEYVVNIQFADMPSEVTTVQVPVWTKADQSDLKWLNATQISSGNWQAVINIKEFKASGTYNVHVYATLDSGLQLGIASTSMEVSKPSFDGVIQNYIEEEGTFEVVINSISSLSGVDNIQIPVWCADDQSDLVWYSADKQEDGSYKTKVSIANHNYSIGTYKIHAYLTAGNGICVSKNLGIQEVGLPDTQIIAENIDEKEMQYLLTVSNIGLLGNVQGVSFATWSEKGGQDDLVWYTGHKNADGNWETTIDIQNHKTAGTYEVDVYYTLANGVMKGLGSTFFEVSTPSMATSIENYDDEKGTFEVVVSDIVSPSGVDRVQVPVWCASDQSDIRWYDAEKQNDGSYKAKISIANHNFAIGTYQVYVYVTTKNGLTQGVVAGTQNVSLPDMEIIAEDATGEEMTYKVQATNVGLLGVLRNVMFATWSEQGGQDDLVWYTGHKNADGNWETTIDIQNHKTAGTYEVDVYYTLANGVMKGLGSTFFEVSTPSMATSIENYDDEKGTFEVVVSDIVSPSGVDRVQVPVWCASDQSDIRWYDAEKQNDGSYKAKISIANHNFAIGTYQVYVYVTTKNGLTQGVVAGTQNVSLPDMEIIAEDATGEEMTYKVQATNVGLLGVLRNVMFATWSEQGGQDDLVWYTGHKNADGNWEAAIDIRNHKTPGAYKVDVYYTLANGVMKSLGSAFFEVSGASLTSEISIKDYNDATGSFTVVVPEPQSASGVSSVLVPVWCSEDQSDICWYSTKHQSDGTYTVSVDPINHKYNSGLYKIHVYVVSNNGIQQNVGTASQMVSATQYYTIMGDTTVTIDQMMRCFESSGHAYPSAALGVGGASTLEQFCLLYLEEAHAEGVRAEVAFAQAMKETGWLQYGGIVQIDQFNFAGIGALDGNSSGNCASFPDVRTGIRAQIQHLKAYASNEALVNAQVDPRFHLVTRGSAPYVEWLGQKENPTGAGWATSTNYGYSIVSMIRQIKLL